MSVLSHDCSQSPQFRRPPSIDRVLVQKIQSLTQNLKKVSQTKQILQDSFQQSRYTYSELQKMHNNIFYKYKASLAKIQQLEQQLAHQSQVKELLQKQNDQLYSYFSDNGLNLAEFQLSISALKEVKDKYEVEKSGLLRQQEINKELVKIVEQCLETIQQQAPQEHYSRGRHDPENQNQKSEMVQRMRGFLEFITHNRDELFTGPRLSHPPYPETDQVNELPSTHEYNYQLIDPKDLFLPQLRQNTEKDEREYLKEKYSNPYVSQLLEKISERSREEVTDRSGVSSSKRARWNEESDVKRYGPRENGEGEEGKFQTSSKTQSFKGESPQGNSSKIDPFESNLLNVNSLKRGSLKIELSREDSFQVDLLKKENFQRTREQHYSQQSTPQHLYETLISIEKKFGQLYQQSAQQKSQSRQQKEDLTLQIKQLQEIVIRSREDILQMESQIKQKTGRMTKMRHQLEQKALEAEMKLKNKDNEIEELKKELELERETNNELLLQVQQKQQQIETGMMQIANSQQQIQSLKSSKQQISKELQNLKSALQSSQSKDRQIEQLWTGKVESWKMVALQNETHNKALSRQLETKTQQLLSTSNQLADSLSQVAKIGNQKQEVQKEMIRVKKAHLEVEQCYKRLLEDKNRVKDQKSLLENHLHSLMQSNESLNRQNSKLKQQLEQLKRQWQRMKGQIKDLQGQVGKYRSERRSQVQRRQISSSQSNNDSFHSMRSIKSIHSNNDARRSNKVVGQNNFNDLKESEIQQNNIENQQKNFYSRQNSHETLQKNFYNQQNNFISLQKNYNNRQNNQNNLQNNNDNLQNIGGILQTNLDFGQMSPEYVMNQNHYQHDQIQQNQRHYSIIINQKDAQINQLTQQVQTLNQILNQLRKQSTQQSHKLHQAHQQSDCNLKKPTHHLNHNNQHHQSKQQQKSYYPQQPQITTSLDHCTHQSELSSLQSLPHFQSYKHQKQQQIYRLQQIITQKIQLFETKLTQEQQNSQTQILKLAQTISQLQTHNHLLLEELSQSHDKLSVSQQHNELLKSQIQKLYAQMAAKPQEIGHPLNGRSPEQQLIEKIRLLELSLHQKNNQIESLNLTLQKLKLQLQKTVFAYENSLQSVQSRSQNQLNQKQNDIKDIENHYQNEYQKVKLSYENDLKKIKDQFQSLERLNHDREEQFKVKLQSLTQTHQNQTNAIYSSAREKITALKQLNKKAQAKLIEQENKIQSLEHNLGEFSHLLNEKDLIVQDLVHKIHIKDEEIQQFLRNSRQEAAVDPNPIKSICSQLQGQLNEKIKSLERQLISVQQSHSRNQSTLTKVIDELRDENSKLKQQNQELSKAYQRQSIVNKEKLRYISLQIKKQRMKIHTLTLSVKLFPQVEWGNRILSQITSIHSPIDEMREGFFKAKKDDPIAELNKLKQKYSREKYQQKHISSAKPLQPHEHKLPQKRPSSQLLPNIHHHYGTYQHPQSQEQLFEPILMTSSRQRIQNPTHQPQMIFSNLTTNQARNNPTGQANSPLIFDFPPHPLTNIHQLQKQPQIQSSVPSKDNDFIIIKSRSTWNQNQDVFYDFVDPPKSKLRQSPSMEIGTHQNQFKQLTQRKDSMYSQNSYCSQPQLGQSSRNPFEEGFKEDQLKKDADTKRSMEMRTLEETIRRKKDENEALLREIRQRESKNY